MAPQFIRPMPALAPEILLQALDVIQDYALGTENRQRQAFLLRACLEHRQSHPKLVALGVALAIWSWQSRPLNRDAVSDLLFLADAGIPLPPSLHRTLIAIQHTIHEPEDPQLWNQLRVIGDTELIDRFWDTALKNSESGLYWLDTVFSSLVALPDRSRARRLLTGAAWPTELTPIRLRLLAEMAWHHGEHTQAKALLTQLPAEIWHPWVDFVHAAIELQHGNIDVATQSFRTLWQEMPWHVNIALVAHDLQFSSSYEQFRYPAKPNEAVILMYSYNNAGLLKRSLDSLAASDLGAASVIVLDNGSGDDMQTVLQAARQSFEKEKITTLQLPTNIGAPGARNWLLAHEKAQYAQYAVFLDDDVVVPRDWLTLLLQHARRFPKAGAIGARIRDAAPPHCMQSADINILSHNALNALNDDSVFKERILLFDNCAGSLDSGLFNYTRPCLSVSGCCHAISRQALDAVGCFDIRFNPTQFDDLDRDLRSFLAGFPAVYAGHATIGHVQGSSLSKSRTPAAIANVSGNNIKIENKFDDTQITTIAKNNRQILKEDTRTKVQALLNTLES